MNGVATGFDASGDIRLDFVAASYSGQLPQDLFPAAVSAHTADDPFVTEGAADPVHLASDDFNGRLRGGAADVGAYLYQPDGNPGWALAKDFKQLLTIFMNGFETADVSQWSASLH